MFYVKSIVTDFAGKTIANANITITDANGVFLPVNGENVGRTTDSKGSFVIPVTNEDAFITISSVGYKKFTLPAESAKNKKVLKLQQDVAELPETTVEIPRTRPRGIPRPTTPVQYASVETGSNKKWYVIAGIAVVAITGFVIYSLMKKK